MTTRCAQPKDCGDPLCYICYPYKPFKQEAVMSQATIVTAEQAGLEIHVGDDGVWISIKTKTGRHYTFQPVTSLAQRGYMGADTVREWCNELQQIRETSK